mmetsp:Transcript_16304/g.30442  ORF Transcript_16304/g.30442 Transcript_16304/m.30442 type:complete len:214 (+) Transcript_16304:723-1364(+)
MGSAPSVLREIRACPASWNAVHFKVSGDITAVFLSAPIMILSLAYSSPLMLTAASPSTELFSAAWFTRFDSSAPENPGVPRAICSMLTSLPRGTFEPYSSRIFLRPPTSGRGTSTCLSRRPGRVSAESRDSGKFVAAITMVPLFSLNPSISTSSWFNVIFMAVCSLSCRLPPMASISSMKMMQGELSLAVLNKSRTRRAPTPTYISSNSLPDV